MTSEEIVALSKKHTLSEWSAQGAVDPLPVPSAKGVYFWTPEGQALPRLQQPADVGEHRPRRSAGHRRPFSRAGREAAATSTPSHGDRAARAARAPSWPRSRPGDIDAFFFTNGGAEANENAFKIARARTPAARRFWRATARITGRRPRRSRPPAIRAAGASRRCRASSTCSTRITALIAAGLAATRAAVSRGSDPCSRGRRRLRRSSSRPVTGTNGILVPPDGYMQGVRALCDKHGILMIADEVMSGFGRTGEWFAIDHWNVVPDIITMAKGLTSSYIPLGAVGDSARRSPITSRTRCFPAASPTTATRSRARRRWRRSPSTKRTA